MNSYNDLFFAEIIFNMETLESVIAREKILQQRLDKHNAERKKNSVKRPRSSLSKTIEWLVLGSLGSVVAWGLTAKAVNLYQQFYLNY